MTSLATPPRREGREVFAGLWVQPASLPADAARTREAPVGVGPPCSLQGRRPGREGLSQPGEAPSSGPSMHAPFPPPPTWSNLGIFYPEGGHG